MWHSTGVFTLSRGADQVPYFLAGHGGSPKALRRADPKRAEEGSPGQRERSDRRPGYGWQGSWPLSPQPLCDRSKPAPNAGRGAWGVGQGDKLAPDHRLCLATGKPSPWADGGAARQVKGRPEEKRSVFWSLHHEMLNRMQT
jgi:hypothetical protein